MLLAAMLSVTVGTGASWAGPPSAVGTVGCKVVGTMKFHPKLTFVGTPGGDKFTIKATSTGCSSNATVGTVVVHITGATVTASGYWNHPIGGSGNSCPNLSSDLLGIVNYKYTWTSVPAIAPTKITTSGGVPWSAGPVFNFVLPSGASITASTGSFSPVVSQVINLTTTMPGICAAGWGPFATTAVTSGFFNVS